MKDIREIVKRPVGESVELERIADPQAVPPTDNYPGYRSYESEGFGFLDYWRAIRKRLWLVIGIVVLVTTWAAIYMARKPNVYSAKAVVQVDLEQTNPDLITADSKRPNLTPDPAYFNTQLQLLTSDSLLRRVVKEHNLDTNKDFQPTASEGSSALWHSILKAVGLASGAPKRDGSTSSVLSSSDSKVASSDEIAEAIRLSPYVDLIQKNINVEPIRESRATVKDTRLIEISFRHTDPDLAAFVVNSIAETFVNANQEKRFGTSRKTNDFLQERIASLQSQIKADEEKLVDLTQNAGILKTDGDQTIVIDRLSGLNKQLLDAENERKNAEANYLSVSNSPDRMRAMSEEQMAQYISQQENSIRSLESDTMKKIADLRQTRALRLQDYKESAPEIQEIDAQIRSYQDSLNKGTAKLKDDLERYRQQTSNVILENLRTKYMQAKDKEDKIRTDFNKQYDEAQAQNQSAVNIKLLQQNIETNKGFLDNLMKQQSGNDIAAQGSDNNISVTEIAIPPDTPVSPRRLTTVAAALFISTLFGIGLALFLEYLDDTIRTTSEIESYLRLPALAAIPAMESVPRRRLLLVGSSDDPSDQASSELLIRADSRSSLAEAYRQLRTSILLSTAGHAPKSLVVTSSLPSEGKTTTATNTAISLAQTGAKVLIIDADLRRPRLHSIFNADNNEGLSTLLSSELGESEILRVIKQDDETKLYLLTSGPVPPNPAELIGSEQMANLIKFLQTQFTHVVLDSPPIASFTDGVLISTMVDGVILVVQHGKSSRQIVRRSRQLLVDVGAKIFGVVLNNVNLKTQDSYYYYRSHYQDRYYRSDES